MNDLNIKLLHSFEDKDVVNALSSSFETVHPPSKVSCHVIQEKDNWGNLQFDLIAPIDAWIVVISTNSLNNQVFVNGVEELNQKVLNSQGKHLYLIVFDNVEVPQVLEGTIRFQCTSTETYSLAEKLFNNLHDIRLSQDLFSNNLQNLISNSGDYVNNTIKSLKESHFRFQLLGYFCYSLALCALVAAVLLGYQSLYSSEEIIISNSSIPWSSIVYLSVKSFIVIGLLIACSKYVFSLGKSFLTEALKNADRAHAISFGKFYLDTFGRSANWNEVKEAFQHWNINGDSSFHGMSAKDFDPRFVEFILELSKVALNSKSN